MDEKRSESTSAPMGEAGIFGGGPRLVKHAPATSLPSPRYGATACGLDKSIYVIGGEPYDDGVGGAVLRLAAWGADGLGAGPWERLADMPTPRARAASAAIGREIFVIGGSGPRAGFLNVLESFDVVTGLWRTLPSMTVFRAFPGCAVLNNQLHVIGGFTPSGSNQFGGTAHEMYDLGTGRWERLADLPAPTAGQGCFEIGGKLYVVGGVGPDLIYDPATTKWSALPAWPGRAGLISLTTATAVLGDYIYLFGSFEATRSVNPTTWCLDTVTLTWRALPSGALWLAGGCACAATSVANDIAVVYVMGGRQNWLGDSTVLATSEFFGFALTADRSPQM